MKKNLMYVPAILVLVLTFMYITSGNGEQYTEAVQSDGADVQVMERNISAPEDDTSEDGASEDEGSLSEAVPEKVRSVPAAIISKRAVNTVIPDSVYEEYEYMKQRQYEASLWQEEEEEEDDAPPKISMVVDLDYDTDVDDVVALRVAAQLHRYERIDLKAVMSSTTGEEPCRCMHAQLSHDGLGNVPIGYARNGLESGSPYWKDISDLYFNMYGYKLCDSVELYKSVIRECIANEEKLRIVTTGYLTNIEALLADPQGYALVKNGVESIWITGGVYLQGSDHNFAYAEGAMRAASFVSAASPVPLVYSSQLSIQNAADEVIMVGGMVLSGDLYQNDPVTLAFRAYERRNKTDLSYGRFAWDPFCVWAAGLTPEETLTHTVPVNTYIGTDGWNVFSFDLPANSSLLMRDTEDVAWYTAQIEAWDIAGIRGMSLPDHAFIMGNPLYDSLHPNEDP